MKKKCPHYQPLGLFFVIPFVVIDSLQHDRPSVLRHCQELFDPGLCFSRPKLLKVDLHTFFFNRFQIQCNEKFGSAIATSCHMRVCDSHFTQSEVLGNTKKATPIMAKRVSCNQNSNVTRFLSYPGTPKMVLSHIKYGKAGCDRDITPHLGMCDRDITTLSAHILIGHCLGNSQVTCQNN